MNPFNGVSGDRSSCETVATKSLFSCSVSNSDVTSRATTTEALTEPSRPGIWLLVHRIHRSEPSAG